MIGFIKRAVAALAFCLLTACASSGEEPASFPAGGRTFTEYENSCKSYIAQNRHFVLKDKAFELSANAPFEIKPQNPNGQAILFVHGLGDSPWTFRDIGRALANKGFLVRATLLPGNGTKPSDMIGITEEDWLNSVTAQLQLLKKTSKKVWLGGFSTGCNLVTKAAYDHPEVAGLILFSPAFKIKTNMIAIVPFVGLFTDWYKKPDEDTQGVAPFRYETIPLEAVEAFRQSMLKAQEALNSGLYAKPTIIMMTEHDSVIDTETLIHKLPKIFKHPASRFIWYGTSSDGSDPRIIYKSDYIPEERIESFSHMSLTYSPSNSWYGRKGKSRICRDDLSEKELKKCETAKNVWYSTWESAPDGKITARLMYNPYFAWQLTQILKVLKN